MSKVHRTLAALAIGISVSYAQAAPTIQSTFFYTDHWGPNVAFPSLNGEYLHLFTTVNSLDAPADVSAVATQGDLVRPLFFYTTPILAEKNFERFLTNLTLTGPWDLAVTDTTGSTNGVFPAIVDPELLPLMRDVQIAPGGLTPTVSWTLPDLTGFDVDGIRFRATVASTSAQTFQSGLLDPLTTSFTLPAGVLTAGVEYEFRILLDDLDGNRLENRSQTSSPLYTAAAPIPEPATLALMLAGLGAVVGYSAFRRRS
jgi:PEP-CTERM motif